MSQETNYDYQRYAILFVDDEAVTRKYFLRLFGKKFRILEAEDGVRALQVFQQHAQEIGVIVTDQRMPNETGVGFLMKIADQFPDIIKILSTAYSDIDAAIDSVNQGGIFRYVTKPWDIPQLEVTLRRAMEFFLVKRERDALLRANVEDFGRVLLSSRLAAFALVPLCAKLTCERVAEAVTAFWEWCLGEAAVRDGRPLLPTSPDWNALHARQLELAAELERVLPEALAVKGLPDRMAALLRELQACGAGKIRQEESQESVRYHADADPLPELLQTLLGSRGESARTAEAAKVLAALLAVYDAGGVIRRLPGEGLVLDGASATAGQSPAPGEHLAAWLASDPVLFASRV